MGHLVCLASYARKIFARPGIPLYRIVAACIVGVPLAIWLGEYFGAVVLLCGGLGIFFWELRERGKLS